MKFKIFIIILLISTTACQQIPIKNKEKISLSRTGFAYIYSDNAYEKDTISKKFIKDEMEIGHRFIKPGKFVMLINPVNNKSIKLKNKKKVEYPALYEILITGPVAKEIGLDLEAPLIEFLEINNNEKYVASKAKMFREEQTVSSNAPVSTVKIENISNVKVIKKKSKKEFTILIGKFYAHESALNLKEFLTKELTGLDSSKLSVKKKSKNSYFLQSGPYNTINLLENDYIVLKKYGFEDLNINIK